MIVAVIGQTLLKQGLENQEVMGKGEKRCHRTVWCINDENQEVMGMEYLRCTKR